LETSIRHLIEDHVTNPVRVEIGSITKPAERVELYVYEVEQDNKLALLELMLRQEQGPFLVFTRTKHGADRLAKRLAAGGVKTAAIHGNRSQSQRNQALAGFQAGRYRALVATDVVARGIHVEGIAHVVNYDLPQVPEDFIHRVGRTGRAGAGGSATTFATCAERRDIAVIERTLGIQIVRRPVPAEIAPEPSARVIVMRPHRRSFGPSRRTGRRMVQGAI
jgi:ATP-dependent RNA helicase RhlE